MSRRPLPALQGAIQRLLWVSRFRGHSQAFRLIWTLFSPKAPMPRCSACENPWNLLLDVIVQTGHYPLNASGAQQFMVTGETREWVHLAIDRLTGEVLERQVEFVAE
ncbi:MAG: hypothetical protein EBR81_01615 [Proteobacteria bacterium]|nr:hypothetical protein [Pseudomonadota bacterium]